MHLEFMLIAFVSGDISELVGNGIVRHGGYAIFRHSGTTAKFILSELLFGFL